MSVISLSNRSAMAVEPDGDSHWLVVSDLMASLMMIFLFLALLHMVQLERSHQVETEVRVTAAELRQAIYLSLEEEFRADLPRWNAEFDRPTLTLRFREPEVLFDSNSARIKPEFEAILQDFLPRYVRQLEPFREVIREIRIEGHTSSEWGPDSSPLDAYFANMALSQQRTQEVLRYAYGLDAVQQAQWFRARVAAVGLSSSRLVRDDRGVEDAEASRRVEFSVLTNFEASLLAGRPLEQSATNAQGSSHPAE
ncbi:OmpA family protein [Thiorhodovibrio frisius]|uniref:Outer membrane protein/peptidoglycan-associated (Lipo)protein n=1 Tax=Thiorhodovibrio frisius TaxID=631362 RepID=H8Z4B6_9GAMM|nr:OmpA family protein [Thiorhodovibrio frisius]EIC20173.1 outer membrane protein/peptidoglycan-associated (lipo)protein [Thiorhodovibrio frisius]WPL20910.1 flagellar motor protein MotS [Thiorhodovibrio frisius]